MAQDDRRPTPDGVRQKLETLRHAFGRELPDRIRAVEKQWARVRRGPEGGGGWDDLLRTCHTLAGTAPSMGFAGVGAAAKALEALLKALESGARTVERLVPVEAALGALLESAAHAAPNIVEPQEGALSAPPGPAAPSSSGGRLVVLADDDALLRENLALQIECFGYRVRPVASLSELEGVCEAETPSVLVMDLSFPEGDMAGAQAVARLRRTDLACPPVVFVSRHNDFHSRLEASRVGGAAYFVKPVPIRDLVDRLDKLTSAVPPAPYRVLVVDDDPVIAEYHGLKLRERGMESRVLTDPTQALQHLGAFKPDLVLLDLHMPGCNGYELARVLRQVPAHVSIPIVFLSTEKDRDRQLDALLTGGDDFLTKPIDPDHLVSSVTARAERMRMLRSLMEKDGLTGLYNHSTTKERLAQAVDLARRQRSSLCFAMLDLDHFKNVNDTHGHYVGDAVLVVLSRMLRQRLRGTDLVGRFGGEEFAALLLDTDVEAGIRLLDEVRESFAQVRHDSELGDFLVTFSCGLAAFPDFPDAPSLVKAADQALYAAKRGGRNQVTAARRDGGFGG